MIPQFDNRNLNSTMHWTFHHRDALPDSPIACTLSEPDILNDDIAVLIRYFFGKGPDGTGALPRCLKLPSAST